MINVMLVEDQAMSRQLFEIWLKDSTKYNLLYSIENAALAEVYCLKQSIDLILMDVCTALGESGLTAAADIKKKYPQIKIIIITSMPECSYIERARVAGVESFWYKDADKNSILNVMDRTMAGESIYPDVTPDIKIGQANSHQFSDRELDVLRELISGAPDKVIAEKLHLSVWTVKHYINTLLEKTGFDNRTELAVAARDTGLVIGGY
jgi:two-component system vancomycin resistance associated response regulator VraR